MTERHRPALIRTWLTAPVLGAATCVPWGTGIHLALAQSHGRRAFSLCKSGPRRQASPGLAPGLVWNVHDFLEETDS